MKRWGEWCGEIQVTGLRLPVQPSGAKGEVLSRELGKDAEVRVDNQPYLSVILQCDTAAKRPCRSSRWMKRGAAD